MLRQLARSARSRGFLLSQRQLSQCDKTYDPPRLSGRCACGKVGYDAVGPPASNFITHSSAPRAASGEPYLIASGFKSNQIVWSGEGLVDSTKRPEYMPPNSSNPHYFCPCDKKQYLGVDASRWLGVVAVNLKNAVGYPDNVPTIYRPNHHVFYADRVVDVEDGLPKWKTVLEGEMMQETNGAAPLPKSEGWPTYGKALTAYNDFTL